MLLLLAYQLYAADGEPDPIFNGGLVTTGAGTGFIATLPTAFGVAIQIDGKIVTTGQDGNGTFQTIRYNTDGTLDTSFGGGIVTDGTGFGSGIALQPDDKIIIAGAANASARMTPVRGIAQRLSDPSTNFVVFRYLSNGTLDTSFNSTGKIDQGIGFAGGAALQVDNKIVVAGFLQQSVNNYFTIVRYNEDGSLDTTFGTNGIANVGDAFPTTANVAPPSAFSVQVQADGKIVACGSIYNSVSNLFFFATVRLNSDGTPDVTFGTNGIAVTGVGTTPSPSTFAPSAFSLAIQPNGDIISVGFSANGADIITTRLTTTGNPDPSFGTAGIALPIGDNTGFGLGVALQSDGKIVIAIEYDDTTGDTFYFATGRYTTNGAPDTTYGTNGLVLQQAPFADGGVSANAVAIQSDGKIVASGVTFNTTSNLFFYSTARYLVADAPLAPTVITSPSNGANALTNGTTFTGTAQNPAIVTLFFTNSMGVTTSFATAIQADGTWSITPTGLSDGTYTVFAVADYKDGNVLLSSSSIVVTFGSSSLTASKAIICPGNSVTLTLTIPGTGPFDILWSDGFIQTGVFSPVIRTVLPIATTTYNATITTASGAVIISPSITIRVVQTASALSCAIINKYCNS